MDSVRLPEPPDQSPRDALGAGVSDYHALFEAIPNALLILAPDAPRFTIRDTNRAYLAVAERGREELIGRGVFEAFPDDPDQPAAGATASLRESLMRVVANRAADDMPAQRFDILVDGVFQERWWKAVNAPVLAADGSVRAIIHNVADVTAATKAAAASQVALAGSEQRYCDIVEGAEDFAIITLDAGGVITSWNAGAERMMGLTEADAVGRSGAIFFSAEERQAGVPDRERTRAHSDGRALDERWHLRQDGSRFWGSGLMMRAGDGYLKIFRDRTAEHEAEAALRAGEARYRSLFNTIEAGFCIVEVKFGTDARPIDYRFVETNPAFEHQTGLRDVKDRWVSTIAPELERHWLETCGRVALTGEPVRFEDHAAPLDDRWYDVHAYRTDAPEQRRVAILFTDISEHRRAVAALRESEERFRRIADSAPGPMWVTAPDGTRSFVNTAYSEFIGVDGEEARRFDWRAVIHPDDVARIVAESTAGEASGGRFDLEGRYRRADGEWRWLRSTSQPRFGPDGEQTGFIGVAHDITEAKEAEVALRASEARFRFLDRVAVATRTQVAPEAVLAATARLLGEQLGVDICAYADVGADGDAFHIRCDWTRADVPSIVGSYRLDAFGPAAAAVQRAGEPLVMNDVADVTDEGAAATFRGIGVAATVCVPLVKDGRLAAMMAVHSARPRTWRDEEVALVREAAERCWAHIERMGAEAVIREQAEEFTALADNIPTLCWMARADGDIFWYNRRWYEYTGTDLGEMRGWGWEKVHDPDYLPLVAERWRRSIASGDPFDMIFPLRGADGLFRPFLTRVVPIRDAGGAIVRWFGTNTDVSEQQATAEALRQSEARFRLLDQLAEQTKAEESPEKILAAATRLLGEQLKVDICAYADVENETETVTIRANWTREGVAGIEGEYRLADFGPGIAEPLRAGTVLVLNDVARQVDPAVAARVAAMGVAASISVPLVRGDRLAAMLAVYSAAPRAWSDEEIALVREAAERCRAHIERVGAEAVIRQQAVRSGKEAAERAAILGQIAEGVIVTDKDGRIVFVNAAALRLHGVAAIGVEPSQFAATFHLFREDGSPYPSEHLPLARAVRNGETVTDSRWLIRRPDGTEVIAIGSAQPIVGPEGEPLGAVLTVRDDTARFASEQALRDMAETLEQRVEERTADLMQAQEALRQSQKLETMGQLTGGVAHDFNNLLTPIIGSLDMLQRRGIGGEREQRLIDGALQSADRAKTLVQRLLAFARRQPLQTEAVDVGGLIRAMADLVVSTTGPQIEVAVDAAADLPPAMADRNQLEMAILNLSVNARDAMPDGGTLRISAVDQEAPAGNPARLTPGRYVRLSVADTGSGMDEATLARAIEPFFSTKGIGKGTGLGLSMVHGLASQLGGALTIASQPGLGTNIELWLPVAHTAVRPAERGAEPLAPSVAAGIVLLVDDEDLVRASTADMLADLGYQVVEARCGDEALRLLDDGLAPGLMVTDHLMPGMTGVDLIGQVRGRRPDLPALLISGYAEGDGIAPDLPRLTKPFRHADLAASIAAAAG